ncbi:hypothetical protein [Duganella vulcania]|uniref:Uncharacterized protein n=1 Tax=Duganella vulcania TaxID=2692166 RepID=A0A845GVK2_9BURK|nr:hypothetical protein [Duganella vulcania]MYM96569.1 hypothetical protein [Duganella vulcania]
MSYAPMDAAPDADETEADSEAFTWDIEEISLDVANGLVPFLGQAINIYDTITCMMTLHESTSAEDQMQAKFDLVLALVGWTPGPGGGVKKTIRYVNKYPGLFAPRLFDALRMDCHRVGIHTSAELLLDKLFDPVGLKNQLGTIQSAIEGSWLYDDLPAEGRLALSTCMSKVRAELPAMMKLVTLKLDHWKTEQRNNAAQPRPASAPVLPTLPKSGQTTHYVEFNHHWPDLTPVAGGAYRAEFADGTVRVGKLDAKGHARLENIPHGVVKVYFGEDPTPFTPDSVKDVGKTTLEKVLNELENHDYAIEPDDVESLLYCMAGKDVQSDLFR